jgi:MYND finger
MTKAFTLLESQQFWNNLAQESLPQQVVLHAIVPTAFQVRMQNDFSHIVPTIRNEITHCAVCRINLCDVLFARYAVRTILGKNQHNNKSSVYFSEAKLCETCCNQLEKQAFVIYHQSLDAFGASIIEEANSSLVRKKMLVSFNGLFNHLNKSDKMIKKALRKMIYWCENCKVQSKKGERQFPYCRGCGAVRYCSKECQTDDWKTNRHKKPCLAMQTAKLFYPELAYFIRDGKVTQMPQ